MKYIRSCIQFVLAAAICAIIFIILNTAVSTPRAPVSAEVLAAALLVTASPAALSAITSPAALTTAPPVPTDTPTTPYTPTPIDTPTPLPTLAPTNTPLRLSTNTPAPLPTPTPTNTPTLTNTPTPTYIPSAAPSPSPTNKELPRLTHTPELTHTLKLTHTPEPTHTPSSTPTHMPTPTWTNTPTPTQTPSPVPTQTPAPVFTPTVTPALITPSGLPPVSTDERKAEHPADYVLTVTVTPYAAKFITDIFDTLDTDAAYTLPIELIPGIHDKDSAVSAIHSAISGLTEEQKKTDTGADLMSLFAEEAVSRAASTTLSGDVTIEKDRVAMLQRNSADALAEAEKMLTQNGVAPNRELQADVTYMTDKSDSLEINLEPSAEKLANGNVKVLTPEYAISFSNEFIETNVSDQPLFVTLSANGPKDSKVYDVSFSRAIVSYAKLSLPPIAGSLKYQAIAASFKDFIGGKYNPVTTMLDARINDSGAYYVKINRKDFTDIGNKTQEMRNAITILASKGVMSGTSALSFSPDQTVDRSEIASILTRALLMYNANESSPFTDILKSDWYYGAVGSAYKHRLMSGTSPTTFSPKADLLKGQTASVTARVLRLVMKYRDPPDIDAVLSVYRDAGEFANWMRNDIALDTRENIFMRRADGLFHPSVAMTRGDTAIVLYRLFVKIW